MNFKVGDLVICYEENFASVNGAVGTIVSVQATNTMPEWPIVVVFSGVGPGKTIEWCYTKEGFRVSKDIPQNRIEHATKLHKILIGLP